MSSIFEALHNHKLIPVVTLNSPEHGLRLAGILQAQGLNCIEITFRTDAAEQAIREIREAYPDMLIGAGTILTTLHVEQAISAGANFAISPGFNPTVVKYCQQKKFPVIPGVNNPSMVEQAMDLGLDTLKFFPAEPSGGLPMLKAMASVYPVKFIPTGGVSAHNLASYLSEASVLACGGSWMVPTTLIDNGEWDEISQRLSQALSLLD